MDISLRRTEPCVQDRETNITFKQAPLKESSLKLRESALTVQALKSLESQRITEDVISKIRNWLKPEKRSLVLKDARTVTGWVYEIIRKICNNEKE